MKLNDMTIADITDAAEANSEKYERHWQNCAKSAFREGACWAFNHLMRKGHDTARFQQDPIPSPPSIDHLPISIN